MNCPFCKKPINSSRCKNCSYDLNKCKWIPIKKVYPPDDIIIESILNSNGIPVKLLRKEVSQLPMGIGPMAETRIYVPEIIAAEAASLIKKSPENEDESQ